VCCFGRTSSASNSASREPPSLRTARSLLPFPAMRALPPGECIPGGSSFPVVASMASTSHDSLVVTKSTELHSGQREIPILSEVRKPDELDWALIAKCNDEQDALLLCVHMSRLANEEIARRLGIDKSHWTRIMQGRGNLPARKRTQLMSICGNIAPIQYEAMRFGRQLVNHDVEKEERELLSQLSRVQAQKKIMAVA
jgi:transcriptional regulator with XRE-family HTH domain